MFAGADIIINSVPAVNSVIGTFGGLIGDTNDMYSNGAICAVGRELYMFHLGSQDLPR